MNEIEIRVTSTDATRAGFSSSTAAARRHADEMVQSYTRAGDQAGQALTRGIDGRLRDSRGRFAKEGGDTAAGFGASFIARLGPVLARAPISPHLVAAAAPAAPLIAATLSAGVSAGLAGGAVAAGLAVAVRDPKVKAEVDALGNAIGVELDDAFSPVKPATIASIRIVRAELAKMRPELQAIGVEAARFTAPLTRGVTGFVREALPGLRSGLQDTPPVVRELERSLTRMGRAGGDAVDMIAGGSDEAALALSHVALAAEGTIRTIGLMIRGLTELYPMVVPAQAAWVLEMVKGEEAAGGFGAELDPLANGLTNVGGAATIAADAVGLTAQEMEDARQASIDAFDAVTSYGEALDEAREAVRENGRTLNENTEAGRENRRMLVRLAEAAKEKIAGTLSETSSSDAAARVQKRLYTEFIRVATAMTGSAAKARALATALGLIPPETKTDHKSNAPRTKAEVEALRRKMGEVPATKTTTFKPLNYNFAISRAQALRNAINSIPRFVSIGVRVSADGKVRIPGGGGHTFERWGGIYERAQEGLLRDAEVYSPRSPGRFMIAEPATGGEAFIPKYGNRDRSVGILSKAAGWYGQRLVPDGGGGGAVFHIGSVILQGVQDPAGLVRGLQDYCRVNGPIRGVTVG